MDQEIQDWNMFYKEANEDDGELTLKELAEKKRRDIINKSDDLYNSKKHEEACELLAGYKNTGDVEVLWRLARVKYMLYDTNRANFRQHLVVEAYDAVSKALDIDDGHSVLHKWAAVLFDERSSLDGLAQRIQALDKVKDHLLQANKLEPNDTTTLYLLGSWCFHLADMSWLQRKVVTIFFARPPTSTYEEALKYFKMAEELKPHFYSKNLLMLGKTYLRLGMVDRAKYYLKQAKEHIVHLEVDVRTHSEAKQLLKELAQRENQKTFMERLSEFDDN